MSRRQKVLLPLAALGLLLAGGAGLWVLPVLTGPSLPTGATRLQITTDGPNLSFGCATALLAPIRVTTSGDGLVLVNVASGEPVKVAWPSGFAAWRVEGRAVVADPWGNVVGREGDILDSLGGGVGVDDTFHICPLGIVTRG